MRREPDVALRERYEAKGPGGGLIIDIDQLRAAVRALPLRGGCRQDEQTMSERAQDGRVGVHSADPPSVDTEPITNGGPDRQGWHRPGDTSTPRHYASPYLRNAEMWLTSGCVLVAWLQRASGPVSGQEPLATGPALRLERLANLPHPRRRVVRRDDDHARARSAIAGRPERDWRLDRASLARVLD